jgi:hypothetical protein
MPPYDTGRNHKYCLKSFAAYLLVPELKHKYYCAGTGTCLSGQTMPPYDMNSNQQLSLTMV